MTNPTDRTRRQPLRHPVDLPPAAALPLPSLEVATS